MLSGCASTTLASTPAAAPGSPATTITVAPAPLDPEPSTTLEAVTTVPVTPPETTQPPPTTTIPFNVVAVPVADPPIVGVGTSDGPDTQLAQERLLEVFEGHRGTPVNPSSRVAADTSHFTGSGQGRA